MRLELDDLPPRYRAQAEAQLMRRTPSSGAAAEAKAARKADCMFDSRGEYEYYVKVILPGLQSGAIRAVKLHERFLLYPAREYGNVKCPAAHYTPDFVVEYSTGEVEVVEIKSKFTRRAQRDYIYRVRRFIDDIAEPRGWKFTEHITPDTKEELREWKRAAKEAAP